MSEKNQNIEDQSPEQERFVINITEEEEEPARDSTYEPEEPGSTRMMDIPPKQSEDRVSTASFDASSTRMMNAPNSEVYSGSDYRLEPIEEALRREALEEQERSPQKESANARPEKPRRKKKKHRVLGIIARVVITLVILGICALLSMSMIYAAGDIFGLNESKTETKVEIEQNSTITEIAETLKEEGIIDYPTVFRLYIKYFVKEVNFKPGLFTLHPSMPYDDLITELEKVTESNAIAEVTIKEGANIYEIAEELYNKGVCSVDDFIDAVNTHTFDYDFLGDMGDTSLRFYKLEGYLFPDTYQFYRNSNPDDVIQKMLDNFGSKYSEEMRVATANMGLTIDQVVSLAAIVQAEAPDAEQMAKVASVYWNRLRNEQEFPKMQSDPTAKYAKRVLQPNGASEEIINAYNTYNTQGLPAGPINNPGLEALQATLNPARTNFYFFCTNLDTGEFFYAETYAEHQVNLDKAGLDESEVLE